MTISAESADTVLYFSREDLSAACLSPEHLDSEKFLSLIRVALTAARRPVPSSMELRVFPAQRGIVVFVFAVMAPPDRPSRRCLS